MASDRTFHGFPLPNMSCVTTTKLLDVSCFTTATRECRSSIVFFAFDRLVESAQCTGPFMCYDYQIRSSTVFCIPYRLVRAMDWTFRGLGLSNVNVVVLVPLRF